MIYYIADLHFGHKNVLRFDGRPFSNSEEMEKVLIENWNSRVTEEDTVYVIGDAFWKNEENSIRIMRLLHGEKCLICGNHDRVLSRLLYEWSTIAYYHELKDGERQVVLSHYPIPFYNGQHYGAIMLYGHVHNSREWQLIEKWKKEQWELGIPCQLINVGCMMPYMQYTPRTLDEILAANPMPELLSKAPTEEVSDKCKEDGNMERLISEIDQTVMKLKELHDQAFDLYSQAVDAVLDKRITDEKQVEHILNGVIDLGDDVRFLELSKKLHRHVYYYYPQLVGGFDSLFRSLFEEGENGNGICDS